MSSEFVLVDTNVWIYAANRSADQHAAALGVRKAAIAGTIAACVTTQILFEYVATVSNPKRVQAPIDAAAAWSAAAKIKTLFPVLSVPDDLFARASELGTNLGLKGADVFDLAIAITALHHKVTEVYTFDPAVFSRVPSITVRTP
jgi:predicted nucleic acid-binding protein